MSHPGEGSQADIDSNYASGGEGRKRNKLGYHRTAVACVHCRKRKIRCIPSQDVAEQRCQNCIRLRKECHYHPVDQSVISGTTRSQSAPGLDETPGEQATHPSPPTPDMPTMFTQGSLEGTELPEGTESSQPWSSGSGGQAAINIQSAHWNVPIPQPGAQLVQPNIHTAQAAVPYYAAATSPAAPTYVQQPYLYTQEPLYVQNAQPPYVQPGAQQAVGGGHQEYTASSIDNAAQMAPYYSYSDPSFQHVGRSMTMPSTYSPGNVQPSQYGGDQHFSPPHDPQHAPADYWQSQQTSFSPSAHPSQRGRQGRQQRNAG